MNDMVTASAQQNVYRLETLDLRSSTSGDLVSMTQLRLVLKKAGLPPGSPLPVMVPLTRADVARTISGGGLILTARECGTNQLVGMGMLLTYGKWGDIIGWVEEVAVLEAWQGRGIGQAMNIGLINCARKKGCTELNLTSGPLRTAARALYVSLGYVERDTNMYRLVL